MNKNPRSKGRGFFVLNACDLRQFKNLLVIAESVYELFTPNFKLKFVFYNERSHVIKLDWIVFFFNHVLWLALNDHRSGLALIEDLEIRNI